MQVGGSLGVVEPRLSQAWPHAWRTVPWGSLWGPSTAPDMVSNEPGPVCSQRRQTGTKGDGMRTRLETSPAVASLRWGWWPQGLQLGSWDMCRVGDRQWPGQGHKAWECPQGPGRFLMDACFTGVWWRTVTHLLLVVIFISLYHPHSPTDNDLFQD